MMTIKMMTTTNIMTNSW